MFLLPCSVGSGVNMDEYSLPADALASAGSGGGFMVWRHTTHLHFLCLVWKKNTNVTRRLDGSQRRFTAVLFVESFADFILSDAVFTREV